MIEVKLNTNDKKYSIRIYTAEDVENNIVSGVYLHDEEYKLIYHQKYSISLEEMLYKFISDYYLASQSQDAAQLLSEIKNRNYTL